MSANIVEIRKELPENVPEAALNEIRRLGDMLATMAAMLQATNENMAELRRQVRLLEKVTGAQAAAINRAVRERAKEICRLYGMPEGRGEKAAATAIRKGLRLQFGAGSVKEIPRCDYEIALEGIRSWDDYRAMMAIRERSEKIGR